ncbi:NDP-hexose 2,3-dehydratase family protein [Actinomadura formosensis]|uniref:NDP-hexose 2,3-dehydratase family protein n=1 Tax=Actinomadura formosensis TaxID=60706 RepID=UPI0008301EF4|nr:NDP-hexose 2,3-dehydratase family protein [Actinomadura formosensis]
MTREPAERDEARVARSLEAGGRSTDALLGWWEERRRAHPFRVEPIPFNGLKGWSFDGDTGALRHETGRFFTVEGVRADDEDGRSWSQPIIDQPEVGILGILVKEFGGVLHCLIQAKMEPGNSNLLQLSPTVQATRSNYTRVHRGADVRYLEHFTGPGRGRVLVDVLQSEHGSWFLGKRNRNMVVEAVGDVPDHPDFRWLTLGRIGELLRLGRFVNMDARTVLSCLPFAGAGPARHSGLEIRSWLCDLRARATLRRSRVPLAALADWTVGPGRIGRPDGRFFTVIAVAVEAGNREVTGWTQPIFAPRAGGIVAFLLKRLRGVPHVLARARAEIGFRDVIELGPTVQCVPANRADDPPQFLADVLDADPARVLYDAVLSEEGGRFYHGDARYRVVEVPGDFPEDVPGDFRWIALHQFTPMLQHGHYVNVQARSLIACMNLVPGVRG